MVEDSQNNNKSARMLGKIMANVEVAISPDYGPTPIIKNLISRIGSYDESIVHDVKELMANHVEVHQGRIINYSPAMWACKTLNLLLSNIPRDDLLRLATAPRADESILRYRGI